MEEFIFCSQCGKKIAVGKKFCTECGSPIPVNSVPVTETPEANNTVVDEDATVFASPVAAAPVAPAPEAPAAPAPEAPAAPAPEVPAAPVPEVPVAPVPEVPVAAAPEAPAAAAPEVPVAPVPEVPVAPTPEVPVAPIPAAPAAPAGMTAAQQYEAAMGQKVTAPNADQIKKPDKKAVNTKTGDDIPAAYKPVNMWGYYGLSILLRLPIVGFICTFIFAFAPKNKNIKNYARSYFCAWIVGAILTIIVIALIIFAGSAILAALSSITGDSGALDGATEIIEAIQGIFGV